MDEAAKAEQADQAKAEKPEAAEKGGASHPHQELVGTYRDKGYGDVVIEQGTDTLMIRYYRFNHPLQQVEYDIFKSVGGIINRKVNFISDSKGVVSKLEIQFDRSTPAIVFERVADDTK